MQYLGTTLDNGTYTMQFAFDAPNNYRDMLKFLDLVIDKDALTREQAAEDFRLYRARSLGEPLRDNTHMINAETGELSSSELPGECAVVAIEGHSSYLNSPMRMVMTKHSPVCQMQVSEKDFTEVGQDRYIQYGSWLERS